jgi:TatD DNase family protein
MTIFIVIVFLLFFSIFLFFLIATNKNSPLLLSKMLLVDVHAHLDFPDFENDISAVLENAKHAEIKVIINNGIDPITNRKTKDLAKKYPLIKPAYGFYPVHVAEQGIDKVKEELEWIKNNHPVALGEIGLDYKVGDDNPHGDLHKETQIEAFKLFIRLGQKLDIPLIIHSRKAEEDVLNILEQEKAKKVILHCFMGKKKFVEKARDLGYSFSIPTSVVKSEQLQWIVKNVPLKQLLFETDSPYQGPEKGVRNEPANIALSAKKIAELTGMSTEDLANIFFMNYQKLFL